MQPLVMQTMWSSGIWLFRRCLIREYAHSFSE